eukprot:1193514-Prorocentrum_minimum.AAC.4
MRLLNKVPTVNSTVSGSSHAVGFPASDWSVTRIYPRFLRLIGPCRALAGRGGAAAGARFRCRGISTKLLFFRVVVRLVVRVSGSAHRRLIVNVSSRNIERERERERGVHYK